MSRSSDYVFKKQGNDLILVGDFEGFYQNKKDPWDQSSKNSDISKYYEFSRKTLVDSVRFCQNLDAKVDQTLLEIVEVGCGLGQVTDLLQRDLDNCTVKGLDISKTAIRKASDYYPNIEFFCADISHEEFTFDGKQDVVILNQMLWYILEKFDLTLSNVYSMLRADGYLIISMAFLNEQSYGKNIINGFDGLLKYFDKNRMFDVIYSNFDSSKKYDYNDGLVCLKKIIP